LASPPPSPRPLSPRSYLSEPVPIRQLPGSATLLCGPRLSPPPPLRFRIVNTSHLRTRSDPSLILASRKTSHTRTQSSPHHNHGAEKLRDSDHRDRPLRAAGTGGIRNLRDPEPSQSLREKGEGPRRGGGRRMTPIQSKTVHARPRVVRFKLDDDDDLQNEVLAKKRSVSGLLRLEDGKDSWF